MGLTDIDVKQAEKEAKEECEHCWHSPTDAAADNHQATCCRCLKSSDPTVVIGNPEQQKLIDLFHAHLDECKQCREQPFNLCFAGAVRLRNAALPWPVPPAP